MKRRTVLVAMAAAPLSAMLPLPAFAQKPIVLGFAQVGAESEWRTANTESIKSSAKEAGIDLKFSDAQQKQENQIKAIRSYHRAEGRRDRVLAGRRNRLGNRARRSEEREDSRRAHRSRNQQQGRDALCDLHRLRLHRGRPQGGPLARRERERQAGPINIVELQGTVGSAPAIDRKKGFEEIIKSDPKFKIIRSQTGDFTRAKGKEVMEAFLKAEGKKINVLYAHNDDMAIGAIQAIEEAGMKPGKDIIIISVDGVKGAFEAMMAGKLNVSVECSPLLGPQLMSVVKDVKAGKPVPKRIVTQESIFPMEVAAKEFPNRKY